MYSRRKFLFQISSSAALMPVSPILEGFSEMKDRSYDGPVLRVALLGIGSYATRVANAMQSCSQAKLVGAISGSPQKLKDWQSKFNITEKNCYSYCTFDQIKNNADIDAVYVITPNTRHRPFVLRAAN